MAEPLCDIRRLRNPSKHPGASGADVRRWGRSVAPRFARATRAHATGPTIAMIGWRILIFGLCWLIFTLTVYHTTSMGPVVVSLPLGIFISCDELVHRPHSDQVDRPRFSGHRATQIRK